MVADTANFVLRLAGCCHLATVMENILELLQVYSDSLTTQLDRFAVILQWQQNESLRGETFRGRLNSATPAIAG